MCFIFYFKSGNKEKSQLYTSSPTKTTFSHVHGFYVWGY